MMSRRQRPLRLRGVTMVITGFFCLVLAFHLLDSLVGAQGTAATSGTEVSLPLPVVVEPVGQPPTTAPAEVVIETIPTSGVIQPGLLPVESEATPRFESEEGPALNIFSDPALAQKILFGRKPFVYNTKNRPDPMIVPWVRAEIIGNERMERAQTYLKEASGVSDRETKRTRYLQALDELDQVLKADPTSALGRNAQTLAEKIRAEMDKLPPPGTPDKPVATKPPELPQWVSANTRAIVYDRSPQHNHMVLVGDDMLRINRIVPKFPDVKVVEINRDSVVYEYLKMRFTIKVELELVSP